MSVVVETPPHISATAQPPAGEQAPIMRGTGTWELPKWCRQGKEFDPTEAKGDTARCAGSLALRPEDNVELDRPLPRCT